MTYSKGIVNTGTDQGNANALRAAIVAALDAHPAYEYVDTLVNGGRTVDVIRSIGTLNGDGQDWWLFIHTGYATNTVMFNISSDYDAVSNATREFINGPRHTNDVRDLYVNPTPLNPATASWSTSNTATMMYSGHQFVTSTAPFNWWIDVNNEYVIINGHFFGLMEKPVGSRWRRALAMVVGALSTAITFWIMLFSLGIVIGVLSADKAMQNLTIYLSLVVVVFYLVLSASESKLYWYDLPVFPIMAVITAIGVSYIISYVSMHSLAGKKAKGIAYAAILIFIFCLPYYSIIDFVLSPHTGSDENSSMALYMKSVREGKRQIDGYLFTNDSKTDQNINYYLKIHPTKLPYKDVNDLIPSDKVIIFSPSIKEHINKNYDFEIVESIGDVKVCQIIKIKSPVNNLKIQ